MPRNFKRRIPTRDQFYSSSSEVTNALIKSHYVNGIERTFIENLRVLGLTTSQASTDEIKKRYRLLSKQLHTDKVSGASPTEYSFAQVDDAYKALLAALRKRTSADVVIEIDELERSINEKQLLLQEDIQNKAALEVELMQANAAYHQHNYSYQKLKADYYDAIDSVITDKNIAQVNAFKRIYPSIVKDDLLSGLKGNFLESNDRINYRPLELYKDILLELSADIFLMETLPDASDQHFNQLRPNATFIFVKTPVPALFFLKQTESKLSEFVSVPVDKKKLAEVILPARKIDSNNILQSFYSEKELKPFLKLIKDSSFKAFLKDEKRVGKAWRATPKESIYLKELNELDQTLATRKQNLDAAKLKRKAFKHKHEELRYSLDNIDIRRNQMETDIKQEQHKLSHLKIELTELQARESKESVTIPRSQLAQSSPQYSQDSSTSSPDERAEAKHSLGPTDVIQKVEAFKKIYSALRSAQIGSWTNFLKNKDKLSPEQFWEVILKHAQENKDSRTAKALELTLHFYQLPNWEKNRDLYSKIYRHSFNQSIFSSSSLQKSNPGFFEKNSTAVLDQLAIDEAEKNPNSRRAKISRSLK